MILESKALKATEDNKGTMGVPAHIQHLIHFNFFDLPEEVRHFYLFSLFFTVLVASGSLFLPIYIYTKASLLYVVLFVLFSNGVFRVLARLVTVPVLRKLGIEYAMFFSILSLSIAYAIVHFMGIEGWMLYLVALFEALGFSFYWDSFHTSFGLFGKLKEEGEEMSWFYVLQGTLNITVPLISAATIATFGFAFFYTAVFLFAVVGSLVLLKTLKRTYTVDITIRDVLRSPLKRFFAVEGIGIGIFYLAPLYLYIVLGGVVMLFGWVKTAISLVSMVVARLIGEYFDRKMPLWMGRIMYIGNAIYGVVAALIPKPLTVSVAEAIKSIAYTFHIPLSATIYLVARNGYPAVTLGRSFFISVGKILGLAIMAALVYFMENDMLAFGPPERRRKLDSSLPLQGRGGDGQEVQPIKL